MAKNCLSATRIAATAFILTALSVTCSGQSTVSPWKIVPTKNEMTDEISTVAKATAITSAGEQFDVQAACAPGLAIRLIFTTSEERSAIDYCADKIARLGDGPVRVQDKADCTDTYASMAFPDPNGWTGQATQMVSDLLKSAGLPGGDLTPLLNSAGSGLQTSILAMYYPIKMGDLVKAPSLRVELPLKSGSHAVLKFDLQEKPLHNFIQACVSTVDTRPRPLSPPPIHLTATADETYAGFIDGFIKELPNKLNSMGIRSSNYEFEIVALRRILYVCANLSPELAARLPEDALKDAYPDCFGGNSFRGVHYISVTNPIGATKGPKDWMGIRILPVGPLRAGGGYTFDLIVGAPGVVTSASQAPATTAVSISSKVHLPQGHSTPTEVGQAMANLGSEASGQLPGVPQNTLVDRPPAIVKKILTKGTATIIAPGQGKHRYTFIAIDTRGYSSANLDAFVSIAPGSQTDGSFALFASNPKDPNKPIQGAPLAAHYDLRRGDTAHIRCSLKSGQTVVLGMEGNWFSQAGKTGVVSYEVTVDQ